MTVEEIYSITKIIMFEKPSSTIYDNYLIQNLNRVLTDLFDENNMERLWNGKEQLTDYVIVSEREDDVPYEPLYCQLIIPLGLATYFEIDDDLAKYNLYYTDYMNARIRYQRAIPQDVLDGTIKHTKV